MSNKRFLLLESEAIGGALRGVAEGPGIQQQPPNLTGFRFPRFQDFTVPPDTYGNYAHQQAHFYTLNAQTVERVVGQVNSHHSIQPARPQKATNWLRMLFPKQVNG